MNVNSEAVVRGYIELSEKIARTIELAKQVTIESGDPGAQVKFEKLVGKWAPLAMRLLDTAETLVLAERAIEEAGE